MIETKTSAQVNEFAIVENIFGSHLKAVAKAEDKKHFAIMEGNEILTPFELESHGIALWSSLAEGRRQNGHAGL